MLVMPAAQHHHVYVCLVKVDTTAPGMVTDKVLANCHMLGILNAN